MRYGVLYINRDGRRKVSRLYCNNAKEAYHAYNMLNDFTLHKVCIVDGKKAYQFKTFSWGKVALRPGIWGL